MSLHRRMLLLVAAALMTLMVVAGTALAAPGNNGKGAANASPNASGGITNAIAKSGSGGGVCPACE